MGEGGVGGGECDGSAAATRREGGDGDYGGGDDVWGKGGVSKG